MTRHRCNLPLCALVQDKAMSSANQYYDECNENLMFDFLMQHERHFLGLTFAITVSNILFERNNMESHSFIKRIQFSSVVGELRKIIPTKYLQNLVEKLSRVQNQQTLYTFR